MSPPLFGALLGLFGGLGLWTAVRAAPPLRRPGLEARLGPYLRDAPGPSRLLAATDPASTQLGAVGRLLGPFLGDAVRALQRLVGGDRSVRRRLAALGSAQRVEDFRVEQVVWAAIGLLGGVLVSALMSVALHRVNLLSAALILVAGLLAGVFGCDWWLSARVRRREEALLAEFPVVAELLALAVGAGEGPVAAIERVCRLSHGEMARDLEMTLAQARAGAPLVQAMQSMSERSSLEPLSRFVDGLIIAIERGTPLADVLRAQAGDVRETRKRALLESGGRREIAMMVTSVHVLHSSMASIRAAIYARQSLDRTGEGLAVARQLEDCRRLAADRGWPVVTEYVDNDVSANGKKPRPQYRRLLVDVKAGHITAVVAWAADRLTPSADRGGEPHRDPGVSRRGARYGLWRG